MTFTLLAAACSDDEPAAPAPAAPVDTGAISSAVQQAVQQALQAAPAAPAPVSASEIQQLVRGAVSEIPAPNIPEQMSPAELQQMVESAVSASAAAAPKPPSASEISAMVEAALAAATGDAATTAEIESLIASAVAESSEAALAAAEAAAAAQAAMAVAMPAPAMPAPAVGAGGQKYGGTVKIGVVDFGTMDPALMGLSEGSSLYSELAYDNGTVMWFDGEITPWAIESWSTNDALTQYTFNVRQGINFHHGKEMQAEDIKFTYDRLLDEATASPIQGQINYITNITAADDYTVIMDLDGANAFLPAQMTIYHSRLLPSDIDVGQITSKEFGSGAFTLAEHNPAERTVLERNPNYWRAGAPYLDQIVMFYMPEMTTRVEAIKSGAIDAVFGPSFAALDTLSDNPNVIVKEAPSAGVRVLDFHTDREPFNNKNLRKAIQYAVDRTFVREAALFGRGSNANDHPVGINDQYYWDEQPIINQDLEKAQAYLEAAGYPDGVDITLTTSDFGQKLEVALAFKESVAAANIRVDVRNEDSTTYWEEFWMNPCCPFVASSWGARPANEALSVQLRSGGVWNESYYENTRLDELLDLANGEPDVLKRKAYFQEIQEMLIEDVPVLYLMYTPVIVAHRNRVMDVQAHPGLSETFIENWWVDN